MVKTENGEKWLIFIDTNIFLDFYRSSTELYTKQLAALERHKDLIIICDQVRMEFLKNRQKVIQSSIQEFKALSPPQVPTILRDLQASTMLRNKSKEANEQLKKVYINYGKLQI